MRDPYKILGISNDADTDEIKKAYRRLSRKYHPDANINNPHKDSAEAKFKEIQEAYKQIIDMKENGERSYSSSFRGFKGNDDIESQHLQSAEVYINNRKFKEALNVLDGMTFKSSIWYYYHAAANQGMGNHLMALDDAKAALRLEPDNIFYMQFYNKLSSAEQWYQNQSAGYGFPSVSMGDCCIKLLLFNCICGCCL